MCRKAAAAGTLSVGRVSNTAELWVNGISLSQVVAPPPPPAPQGRGSGRAVRRLQLGGGRGNVPPLYELPAGVLKPGANTITVRITNNRNDGGFLGTPETMFVQAGEARAALAGAWRYRVERQTNAGALYMKPGELAAHVAYAATPAPTTGTLPEQVVKAAPDVVIRLTVTPGRDEVRQDGTERHSGTARGDRLHQPRRDAAQLPSRRARFPSGDRRPRPTNWRGARTAWRSRYVPQIPQVLFFTKLVEPGETVTVQFKAPAQPGQYPYVCTFPGHWRIMNGILTVQAPQGRGRRRTLNFINSNLQLPTPKRSRSQQRGGRRRDWRYRDDFQPSFCE